MQRFTVDCWLAQSPSSLIHHTQVLLLCVCVNLCMYDWTTCMIAVGSMLQRISNAILCRLQQISSLCWIVDATNTHTHPHFSTFCAPKKKRIKNFITAYPPMINSEQLAYTNVMYRQHVPTHSSVRYICFYPRCYVCDRARVQKKSHRKTPISSTSIKLYHRINAKYSFPFALCLSLSRSLTLIYALILAFSLESHFPCHSICSTHTQNPTRNNTHQKR